MTTMYAVRHLPTRKLFPNIIRGGSTYVEVTDLTNGPPRLFTTERAAKGWLTTYCKGPVTAAYDSDEWGQTKRVGNVHDKEKARPRTDFEIISVELIYDL